MKNNQTKETLSLRSLLLTPKKKLFTIVKFKIVSIKSIWGSISQPLAIDQHVIPSIINFYHLVYTFWSMLKEKAHSHCNNYFEVLRLGSRGKKSKRVTIILSLLNTLSPEATNKELWTPNWLDELQPANQVKCKIGFI